MTATTADEKVAAYLHDCGPAKRHEGYGFFWLLLEVVASQIEPGSQKCSATYPLTTWSRLLYCHHHTVSKYLGKLGVTGMVTVNKHESSIEVIIPNLLKYRDEYHRKSGHSPESVPSKKQIQSTDIETETEEPPKPPAPVGAEIPVRKVHKAIKEALAVSPEEEMVQETAKRLCETHPGPNGCGQAEAAKQIRGILKKLPRPEWAQKLLSIEQNHAAWCLTEKWVGGYASGLANWLAPTVFRYDTKPTSNGNGHANPKVFVDDGLFEKLSSPDEPPLSPVAARYKQS